MNKAKDKKTICLTVLRILLMVISTAFTAWIFSNSLKDAPSSSEQSQAVTGRLQAVVAFLAPNSFFANASGEDLERAHAFIRTAAHFLEFALLGALYTWTYLSFTVKKSFSFIPFACAISAGVVDECLQLTSIGRAFEWTDVLIDCCGVGVGWAAAGLVVWLTYLIIKNKKKKEKENE